MARTAGSHSDVTGPRIRRAALSLFARHGYAAVSMRQIAAEVGVQAGALYNYIPDKQTLLSDLMTLHLEELLGAWRRVKTGTGALAALEAFTRFHIAYNLDRPDEVFIAYMELRNLEPSHFEEVERLRSSYEQELEAILKDGVAEGVFDVPDPRISSMAIIAMLTGVNTWYRSGGRLSREEVSDLYWRMVVKLVRDG